ncbi:MurR/RpiR family transcriptional regulator [Aquincola sp. MAHUQ-54]|uniref:MurR/RpiR family transcriptional regulator n=1 Tax=Aquincola agrisoli TaxID=3119538 RepID=A0AAW9QKK3_9BURK
MASPENPSFLARVRQQLQHFHPVERRLADFVIDFPGDLASYSATELASLAGVSNATVSRFIKRLGYQHYEDARRSVREEKESGSPLFLASRASGVEGLFAAQCEASQDNLRRTMARLHEAEVDRIAKALLSARKVWIAGFRSSHSFATYFRWQLFQVKENCHVVPHAGDTLGQYAASIVRQDVVVVFGLRRRPAGLRDVVSLMVDSGAKVLYVTDDQVARHPGVTWHLQCRCASQGLLDDHAAVIGVCHLLVSRVIELAGPQERERLQRIESSYSALHEL